MLLDLTEALLGGAQGSAVARISQDLVLCRTLLAGNMLTIMRVTQHGHRQAAEHIISRMYGWRGYGNHHELPDHASRTTFIAYVDEEARGTITLTVDSPHKLGVDATFPEETERLRRTSKTSLCELTKFAFDPSPRSRPMLAVLFHVIFMYGTQRHDCTDLVIEVNPRHVRFYEASLGFERVGPLRANASVNAPSQLMRLQVAHIDAHIKLLGGRSTPEGHSLYQHFLGQDDAEALRRRIATIIELEHYCQARADEPHGTQPSCTTTFNHLPAVSPCHAHGPDRKGAAALCCRP